MLYIEHGLKLQILVSRGALNMFEMVIDQIPLSSIFSTVASLGFTAAAGAVACAVAIMFSDIPAFDHLLKIISHSSHSSPGEPAPAELPSSPRRCSMRIKPGTAQFLCPLGNLPDVRKMFCSWLLFLRKLWHPAQCPTEGCSAPPALQF